MTFMSFKCYMGTMVPTRHFRQERLGIVTLARPMISIVDDDDFVRESLRDLIESHGYGTATFESAEGFLGADCLPETSCLITDLQMPGLSGLDLQSRLIADGRRIPVIFVTAFPDEKFRVRAMSAGAVSFLSKPLDESSLINCLETALNLSPHQSTNRPPAAYRTYAIVWAEGQLRGSEVPWTR